MPCIKEEKDEAEEDGASAFMPAHLSDFAPRLQGGQHRPVLANAPRNTRSFFPEG